MKRNGKNQPPRGATLGDALPQQTKDELGLLRNSLAEQAQSAAKARLDKGLPPWSLQRDSGVSPDAQGKEYPPGVRVVRVNSGPSPSKGTPRREEPVPKTVPSVFEYWDLPNNAASLESPPTSISSLDRSRLNEVLRKGSERTVDDGEDLFFVLGLDFGTSSTKVIVRLPYETGEPSIAIPAPEPCRSGQDSYLWQTVLWLQDEGTFSPWPEPRAEVLKSLKHGIIQDPSNAVDSGTQTRAPVDPKSAAVAYIAYVVRYVKGWLRSHRRELFRRRRPVWFLNLGMPAASYDDVQLAALYRRIGSAGAAAL